MKVLSLFVLLFLFLMPSQLAAQLYKEKTIFELLKVKDLRNPLNKPSKSEKQEEILAEDEKLMIDEAWTGVGHAEAMPALRKLADWLKIHPAGKKAQEPELRMDMIHKGPFYDSRLEYLNGGFRVVSSDGQTQELGTFFYIPAVRNGTGFNVSDKGEKSRYYNAAGQLIFDRKFGYAEADRDNCYRFYEGKKCGIADSNGKILLPAEYDEAYSFAFNKQTWFSVEKDGKRFYLEPGSAKPVMENENGRAAYLPEITANRYWVTNGRVYDMLKREEIFASINKEIHLLSDRWPLFYIERKGKGKDGKEEVYFDAAGKLLLQQPLSGHNGLSDTTSIMRIFQKDTLVDGEKYSLFKLGIIHDKGQWLRKPVYDYLEQLGRTQTLVFITSRSLRKPGLMDASGKILIPEGRFFHIDEGARNGQYVCIDDSVSLLWDRKTGLFTRLPKKYFIFRSFGDLEKMGFAEGITTDNEHFLLDTNYNLLDTTAWADISYPPYGSGLRATLSPFVNGKHDHYAEEVFLTADLKKLGFTWNGIEYKTFEDVDSLAPGSFFFRRKDKKNIVQVKPGQYFSTTCDMIQYDPFFNWYIGRMQNNTWGLLDENGTEILPFIFNQIDRYSYWFQTAQFTSGSQRMQLEASGNLLFDGKYTNVEPVTAGFFIVENDAKKGLFTRSGKEILPVKYSYAGIGLAQVWYGESEATAQSMPVGSLQEKE